MNEQTELRLAREKVRIRREYINGKADDMPYIAREIYRFNRIVEASSLSHQQKERMSFKPEDYQKLDAIKKARNPNQGESKINDLLEKAKQASTLDGIDKMLDDESSESNSLESPSSDYERYSYIEEDQVDQHLEDAASGIDDTHYPPQPQRGKLHKTQNAQDIERPMQIEDDKVVAAVSTIMRSLLDYTSDLKTKIIPAFLAGHNFKKTFGTLYTDLYTKRDNKKGDDPTDTLKIIFSLIAACPKPLSDNNPVIKLALSLIENPTTKSYAVEALNSGDIKNSLTNSESLKNCKAFLSAVSEATTNQNIAKNG